MRNDEQNKTVKGIILGVVIILVIYIIPNMGIGGNKVEKVRQKIEESLLEKYGEEFIVDRIGMRNAAGEKFYQARIYPKAIVGTDKEGDKYYYSTASIEIKIFGQLYDCGDNYSDIKRNDDVEKYLQPKIKSIFGEKVRLKVNAVHKVTGDGSWWAEYGSSSLKEMNKKLKKDPEHNRLELTLYIYIFDKIDNEEEKEKRRREIFEYIGYLKKEGLFEYLEMGVIFIDERVLTPSYKKYEGEIFITKKDEVEVEGKTVYLPPMKLRKEMSKVLEEEVSKMSEDELTESMKAIQKSNLEYVNGSEYLRYSNQSRFWIESIRYLKEINKYGGYRKALKNKTLNRHYYKTIDDLEYRKYNYYILGEDK